MTEFYDENRAKQIVDFEGIQAGTATPTDIDSWLEYHGKAHLFYEFKHASTKVPFGQRLALERLVNDIDKSGKRAIAIVCEHYTEPNERIMAKDAIVREFYFDGDWHNGFGKSLLGWTKRFMELIDGRRIS